jgi:C-8 sterol isomerase
MHRWIGAVSVAVAMMSGISSVRADTLKTRADVVRLYNQLERSARGAKEDRGYVFDVETLHQITKKGVGLPAEKMFEIVQNELIARYGDHIAPDRRWIFNVAGGAMGQLTVLFCSLHEYLIFFGTPIGTNGFSGRYAGMDVYDFMMDGTMSTYTEGQFTPEITQPGQYAHLPRGQGKGYKVSDHSWMLEYSRGSILPSLNFGVWTPTAYNTLDWHSAWNQIHDCGKLLLHEAFGHHHPAVQAWEANP